MVLVQNPMPHSHLPTLGSSILYELEFQVISGLPSLNAWEHDKLRMSIRLFMKGQPYWPLQKVADHNDELRLIGVWI